ncbi:MAG TPA: hypothetical protein VF399_03170 [bacterium]
MLLFLILSYIAREDSNCQYLLDKQLAHYFPAWECYFDSSYNGMRTSQGCLDLLNWYIDLQTRYEVLLSRRIGLRYRNHYRGDYNDHINNHYFDPLLKLNENFKLILSITTHYYKGENEIGVGYQWGKDYMNFMETFISVENFDRNFSLKASPEGPDKFTYSGLAYPIKLITTINKTWTHGRLNLDCDLSTKYKMHSTILTEEGWNRKANLRVWHDIKQWQFGIISNLQLSDIEKHVNDYAETTSVYELRSFEMINEPMIAWQINAKWKPVVYFTYDFKTVEEESLSVDQSYERNIFAYLVDLEFSPGGRFIWHLGTQRQFYESNCTDLSIGETNHREFKERRINVGLEYRYNNFWFYLVEAMEGDFPTEKYLHNHTYLQMMLKF